MTEDWLDLCRRLVPGVLREQDWRLVTDMEVFVRWVADLIISGHVKQSLASTPEQAAVRATHHAYSQVMYDACRQNGTARQNRAFVEAGREAEKLVHRKGQPQGAADLVAQNTVEIVWKRLAGVHDPGCFLQYIRKIAFHEMLKVIAENGGTPEMLPVDPDSVDMDDALERFWDRLASVPPADEEVLCHEQQERVWAEVRRVLASVPRYLAVIVGFYRYGLSISELARLIETTPANISVIKHRALDHLQRERAVLWSLCVELGKRHGAGGEKR